MMRRIPTSIAIFTLLHAASSAEPEQAPISANANDDSLFAPFEHIHFSDLGTPIIHSFGIEPAFTGRDLFLDYGYATGDGFEEHEIEMELEWAFTRRLGVIVEAPYIFENEDGEDWADGWGDLAIVPRILLLDKEKFSMTAQLEVVTPTGTNGFGGETALGAGLASWFDLGNWWTLNSFVAYEHVFDEDVDELLFGFGLIKSLGRPSSSQGGHDHSHPTTEGLFHMHAEVTGSVGLSGEDEGAMTAEGLLGFSYGLNHSMDFRIGYRFPITSPKDFDSGIVSGIVWHF